MTWQPKHPLKLDKVMTAANVLNLLDPDDIAPLAAKIFDGYVQDLESRKPWTTRQADANKLALQVVEEKSFPWPHAANVKFPLVTVAALQYQARAYPALIPGADLVKCKVYGTSPELDDQARRISAHMSWQNLEQDPGWEEEHDKLLLVQAIAGTVFTKRVFEPGPGRQITMMVLPKNFVVNYHTRSLDDSPRYTHTFYLNHNNIRQRELDGRYLPPEKNPDAMDSPIAASVANAADDLQAARDERQGIHDGGEDDVTPWFTGEQYCWYDLDGDGYEEPYIATFDIASGRLRRIVARFVASGVKRLAGGEVYKITPLRVFTKYGFIPSPDGGFYDLGLGSILGPVNATVNTLVNQMLDAGTMATLGGGFLGRGFKGRSGPITFAPHQWHSVDAPGDDLRKNVLPLPVREPSDVLFKLLGLLLQYGERIVSATDIQVGENPGQNTPAETTRTMNENGARVYSGIYKRTWRGFRDQYRIQFEFNRLFLSEDDRFRDLTTGQNALIKATDYEVNNALIAPAADPHVVSDAQAEKQAGMLVQMANSMPNFNRYKSTVRLLKAMKIPNIDEIYPPPKDKDGQPAPDIQPPPNPKMLEVQVKMAAQQLKEKEFQAQQQQLKIELQMNAQELGAVILQKQADAAKKMAEAKSISTTDPMIQLIYAEIESTHKQREHVLKLIEMVSKGMGGGDGEAGPQDAAGGAGGAALAGGPGNAAPPAILAPQHPGANGAMGGPGAGGR